MVNLQSLTHKQLGDFIILSLEHGTNTQFSFEVLHEVGTRLIQINQTLDEQVTTAVYNALKSKLTAFQFTPQELREKQVELKTDVPFDPIPKEEAAPVALTPDEIPQEEIDKIGELLDGLNKEPSADNPFADEPVDNLTISTSVTADEIKAKALELRQKNKVSASAIKDKLAQLGAKTIVTLDVKHYADFNAFLDEHNTND